MKRELIVFATISCLLFLATPASAFSFTDFYKSLLDNVQDFITGKAGGGPCTPGETQSCETGLDGICNPGTQTCGQDSEWGSCIQNTQPTSEICDDGLDNDCNGRVDSFDPNCDGVCNDGIQNQDEICIDVGGVCNSQYPYESGYEESCQDGRDNDCDGLRDLEDSDCDDCTLGDPDQYCMTGLGGICSLGIRTCEGTNYGECIPVEGIEESLGVGNCEDGFDNDCDGNADLSDSGCVTCIAGSTQSCDNGLEGICGAGTQTCSASNIWGECTQTVESTSEICADNLDNDCNGQIDESGCVEEDTSNNEEPTASPPTSPSSTECVPKSTQECTTGNSGICSTGTKTCSESGFWENCIQNIPSKEEICNDNLDNDCDGELDEADCETEELIVTSPIDCEITSARWSQDTFGQDYILRIESKGDCDDAEIEIKIYETDVIVNDPIRTQFSTFNNGNGDLLISLSKEEVATVASGFLEGNQFEVVFKAVVRYTNQKWTKSDVLQI